MTLQQIANGLGITVGDLVTLADEISERKATGGKAG